MQNYVCIADFVYMQDKYGRPYGWGAAEYTTLEDRFGHDFITSAYQRDPQESRERILRHLQSILPSTNRKQLEKIINQIYSKLNIDGDTRTKRQQILSMLNANY